LLLPYSNIVANHDDPDVPLAAGTELLGRQTKVKSVARVVHDDDQTPLRPGDQIDTTSDLCDVRRREDIAADGGIEQTRTDKASMGGLVA
jgi:hypothetical protein